VIAVPATPALSVSPVSASPATVSGSCDPGDTVTLSDGSIVLTTFTCTSGTWSWTGPLALGRHSLSVRQSEPVLGLTSAVQSAIVTVYAPPGAPTLTAPATSGAHVSLGGTCVSGDKVQVYDGDTVVATAGCSRGSWSTTTPALANGVHALSASQVDATSGLEGARSGAVTTSVVGPPPAPTMSVPALSGTSVPVTGTGVAGDTITVTYGRSSVSTTVAADGTWSVGLSLSWGFWTISATQGDAAGQTSGSVSAWVYVGR
jgi:large repetitive protein